MNNISWSVKWVFNIKGAFNFLYLGYIKIIIDAFNHMPYIPGQFTFIIGPDRVQPIAFFVIINPVVNIVRSEVSDKPIRYVMPYFIRLTFITSCKVFNCFLIYFTAGNNYKIIFRH